MVRKGIIVIFSAILVAVALFFFYVSGQRSASIKELRFKEIENIQRCGTETEQNRLCSLPSFDFAPFLMWDNEGHRGSRSLKLILGGNESKYYLGAHYDLSLVLFSYLDNGILECWIKGKKNYTQIATIDMCLKEGPGIRRIAGTRLPVKVNDTWQKISIPLNKFVRLNERDYSPDLNTNDFTWEIQDILFSVSPFSSGSPAELLIADLRIMNGEQVMYELF